MRRFITIIPFLVFGFISSAQGYIPLLRDGNTWNLLSEDELYYKKSAIVDSFSQMNTKCLKSALVQYKKTYISKLSNDSTVGELIYKKVLTSFDSLSNDWILSGLIREDTINQIVYFKESNYDEQILYSFNVKVNDTVGIMMVSKVDTILINNKPHKRIGVSWGRTWIEGIGGLSGLLTSSFDMPMCGPRLTLLCMYNNDSLLYKADSTNNNCFYWEKINTGLHTTKKLVKYDLYPNPTSEYVNIKTNFDESFRVKLLDLQGRVLISHKIYDKNTRLDLNGIVPGIYIVEISNETNFSTTKIMKK